MARPPKLLRLWGLYARMNLVLLLRSKQQFFTYVLGDLLARGGTIVAVLLLAERFGGIAGWSQAELVFLLGYGLTVSGIEMLLFNYNLSAVSRRIGRGQLDHSLLQPQPLALTFITEGFAPVDAVTLLLPGTAMMSLSLSAAGLAVTPLLLGMIVVSLIASATVLVSFNFIFGSLAFWAPQGAEELSPAATNLLQSLKIFPLDAIGPAFRGVLLTIIPAGFLAWFPSATVLGRSGRGAVFVTVFAALAVVSIATFVFRKGLSHYGRTGSQRYSVFGHRR